MSEDDGSRFARAIKREIECAHEALACLYRRDFAKAQTAFTTLAKEARATGNTTRAKGYKRLASTARRYAKTSPQGPWDGTNQWC